MAFAGGDGSLLTPWQVSTADQLDEIRLYLGAAHGDKYFELINNIDLTTFLAPAGAGYNGGLLWEPIGTVGNEFYGHLTGNTFTISGLQINRPLADYVSLFGVCEGTDSGYVNDFVIETSGAGVLGKNNSAIVIGMMSSGFTIENVNAYGDLTAGNVVGSICGWSQYCSIINCIFEGNVTYFDSHAGGIVGAFNGWAPINILSLCSANVIMNTTDAYSFEVGGLAGRLGGGLAEQCFSEGTVNGGFQRAGLIGYVGNVGEVKNCYSRADVSGSILAAGLICENRGSVTNCYATGICANGVGSGPGIDTDNFWDTDTSGTLISGMGTGKTTVEMKLQITFPTWDFTTVWGIDPGINDGYPSFNPAAAEHTLIYSAGAGGSILGTTPQTVPDGNDGTAVTAVADPGYRFDQWDDGVLTAVRQDLNVIADITVSAIFIKTYDLNYAAGTGGSLTGDIAQTVDTGNDGTAVTAVADPGYRFDQWSDGNIYNPRQDLNVTENINVTALFIHETFTLNYEASEGGSVDGYTVQNINYGSDGSTVIALADSGYVFTEWSDGIVTPERRETNVIEDLTVIALFEAISIIIEPDPLVILKKDSEPSKDKTLTVKAVNGKIILTGDRIKILELTPVIITDHEGYYLTDVDGYILTVPWKLGQEYFSVKSVSQAVLQPAVSAHNGLKYYLHPDGSINLTAAGAIQEIAEGTAAGKWRIT